MLNPNNSKNRLDYGEILSPPNNYILDFAIGTTYSLDLDALVGASISLGLSEETDTNLINNPIFLLKALRTTKDNVVLFCEGGQIHFPKNINPLYVLLEDMVFQVNNLKVIKNRYASFHPKFWLVRYTNEENNVFYRLVVLSRNLTFDRSWDISLSMDGFVSDEKTDKNDPIKEFLMYLKDFSTNDVKSSKMAEIINELSFVHFELNSNDFFDFEFIPNGIKDYSIEKCPLFKDSFDEILIMSPFLSKTLIRRFNKRINDKSKAFLFTRAMALSGFKHRDCNNFEIYTLKDQVIDGESALSEESDESSKNEIFKQDIHAKMFMIKHGEYTDLYLGSLNATNNALNGNIEFMVKIRAESNKLNINSLAEDLFDGEKGGPNSPFQLVNIENIAIEEAEDNGIDLNSIIKILNRADPKSNIIPNENHYNIELSFENFKEDSIENMDKLEIKIRPLFSNKQYIFEKKLFFEKLDKIQLSEFFVVSVKNLEEADSKIVERVIKVPTSGMPEDREKEIISSVVDDKEAFIRYVAFLLGDEYILSAMEMEEFDAVDGFKSSFRIRLPELYEKMLKASVYAPEKFDEIDFLIKTLSGDDAIPEGFEELYISFKQVVDENE